MGGKKLGERLANRALPQTVSKHYSRPDESIMILLDIHFNALYVFSEKYLSGGFDVPDIFASFLMSLTFTINLMAILLYFDVPNEVLTCQVFFAVVTIFFYRRYSFHKRYQKYRTKVTTWTSLIEVVYFFGSLFLPFYIN